MNEFFDYDFWRRYNSFFISSDVLLVIWVSHWVCGSLSHFVYTTNRLLISLLSVYVECVVILLFLFQTTFFRKEQWWMIVSNLLISVIVCFYVASFAGDGWWCGFISYHYGGVITFHLVPCSWFPFCFLCCFWSIHSLPTAPMFDGCHVVGLYDCHLVVGA